MYKVPMVRITYFTSTWTGAGDIINSLPVFLTLHCRNICHDLSILVDSFWVNPIDPALNITGFSGL